MKIVLKGCLIADHESSYHNKVQDILIEDGIIKLIQDQVDAINADTVVDEESMIVSAGWVDPFANLSDPGYEFRETLASGAAAAAAGGFTRVFCLPNTKPVIDNKSQVEYIVSGSKSLPVTLHPLGAVSKSTEGKELAEMYDMHQSGAVAFTDGVKPIQSSALCLKGLQYVRGFNGVLIQVPVDNAFTAHGLMNEGIVSTRLGMPGIPAIGEELMIKRDIELLEYTRSHLHFTGVSTAKGLNLIAEAKDKGFNVTCSVTPHHLFYCDEDLQDYNTFLKHSPPLRTRNDMLALRKGIESEVVDCIATHHTPHDVDAKQCEFQAAKDGMISLQTAFSVVNTVLPHLSETRFACLFSLNARSIFRLPPVTIKPGEPAELTIFTKSSSFTLTDDNNKSRSSNTPFLNTELRGKVIGIIHKNKLVLNN